MAANIVSSPLSSPELSVSSLSRLIFQKLSCGVDSIQIVDAFTGRKWRKHQVLDSALKLAAYLRKQYGLKTGEVVLFVTENSDIHAIAILGVLMAGCVYGSAPEHSTEREVRELVSTVRPRLLIGFDQNYDFIEEIGFENTDLKTLLLEKALKDNTNGHKLTVKDIYERPRIDCPQVWPIETGLDSTATLVMSSGSTGRPKAVIRTNRNHLSTIAMFAHKELCPLTAQDVFLSSGFCHICGQRSLFSTINAGAQLLVARSDESHEEVFSCVAKYSVTACLLIPTQLNYLVKNEHKFNKNSFPLLRDVLTGASILSAQTYRAVVEMFGFERFRNSYGMSESGFALTVHYRDIKQLENVETVGKVNPGMKIKIIDSNGNALPANQIGEICIGGQQVSPGYLNSTHNAGLFTADGFLRSGDIGYYDEKHFFYIIGRIKDTIQVDGREHTSQGWLKFAFTSHPCHILLDPVSNYYFIGVSVRPAELEHILIAHKDVENAAVIGVKDDLRGEIPMAFVTLVEGSDVSEDTLLQYVNSRVNDFKKLRAGLKVLDRMPVTHSGKISKAHLLANALI